MDLATYFHNVYVNLTSVRNFPTRLYTSRRWDFANLYSVTLGLLKATGLECLNNDLLFGQPLGRDLRRKMSMQSF